MPTGAKPYTMSQFPTEALRPKPETPKPDAPFETLNLKPKTLGLPTLLIYNRLGSKAYAPIAHALNPKPQNPRP